MTKFILMAASIVMLLIMMSMLFPKFRKFLKIFVNSALGIIALFAANLFGSYIGISLALNIPTLLISAVLGLPGIGALLIMQTFI